MRRVLLAINQTSLPGERSFTRTLSLYQMLEKSGHEVRIVTSIFNHYDKEKRDAKAFREKFPDWNVTFIDEPGYEKNVTLKRVWSEIVFANNLYSWFKKHASEYDVVYMTMPTNEGAYKVGKYCNEHNIPYIVDVRDLWPDAMSMFIKPEALFKTVTWPMKVIADKAYAQADGIVSVSQEYLNRALQANPNCKNTCIVYQGASLSKFDDNAARSKGDVDKPADEFWIAYIGTLGESYDLKTFIEAVHELHKEGYPQIKAKILGRGPCEADLKSYAAELGADIDFVGFMPYERMAGYLCNCDAMINAIKKDAAQSIVNKVSDYFASGRPTLNGSTNPEMMGLIDQYHAGLNYEPENADSLKKAILQIHSNKGECEEMGKGARRLCEERFDRDRTFLEIIDLIDNVNSRED